MLADLYLCASAISTASIDERLDAAADAGYGGIGLRPSHYAAARAHGRTDSELRAMLAARNLELVEIGFLAGWWETGDAAAQSRGREEDLYRLRERLGGRHMVLIGGPLADPAEAIAERFAAVCDRAREHGLLVGLEFLPWTDTCDAGKAWQIADLAGRPNCGVILDSWHHFRGTPDANFIRAIPPDRVIAIQLSDGMRQPVGSDLEDTFSRRRLPGQGDFALDELISLLCGMGVSAPVGTEVLSDELRELPPAEAARRMAVAARKVLAAVHATGKR